MQEKTERVLNRRKMSLFLDEMAASGEIINSLYIPEGADLPDAVSLSADIGASISKSETGAVVFLGRSRAILVLPPFPIKEMYLSPGCHVEPLRSLLTRDYKLALILVRLGAYAIGVCEGERLVASKVGTGLIHAHHKKGGSSQQ
ncbi:MAG: Vms1/Ankzf1 family peptidyl-tRNA hydrolase, partial [Chloroflexota bacterium]